jgi:hypothetical protein
MARKPTGNDPLSEARVAFGKLLKLHLNRGTRPNGSPELTGKNWSKKVFAHEAKTTTRTLTNWLNGTTVPEDSLEPVQAALFGNSKKYDKFRHELREAYRLALGGEKSLGPQSFIHDPGLCLGRGDQIDHLTSCLASIEGGATVLVLGDVGHGKTTVTEKVGLRPEIVERFRDRRWFVELERANSAEAALAAIAEAIGLERKAPQAAVEARLGAKPALLILDNLETPLHADARRTETLLRDLAAIHGLALVASLRSQETVSGVPWSEQIWIEPLKPDVAKIVFLSISPNIKEDDPELDYLLAELDGIPLVLRLVAKRASTCRNLAGLRREWERKGAVLAADPDGGTSRRDSLVHSVEFSLASRRLHESGRRLFSLLGQLPAGLTTPDLDILLGDDGDDAAYQLRQVGLLKDRDDRVSLLSPIRDISRRRHAPDGEMMKRWVAHFISLITEDGQKVGKAGGGKAIARIVPEIPNIESAISALTATKAPEDRAKAISILESYGRVMRYTGTLATTALVALERECANDNVGLAKCKIARAGAARMRSMNELARQELCHALELLNGQTESELKADCLFGLAEIARMQDENEKARGLYEDARERYQRAGNSAGVARCDRGLSLTPIER